LILNPHFYLLFLGMGALLSYEDWRIHKVRNRWILWGLAACAAGAALMLASSVLGGRGARWHGLGRYYLPLSFYPRLAAHLFLLIATAFFTWRIRVWPAGDAKLFILFGLMAVMIDQNLLGFPHLLFLKLLINIFVPAGLWILAVALLEAALQLPALTWSIFRRETVAAAERLVIRLVELWPYRVAAAFYLSHVFALFLGLELINARLAGLERFQEGVGPLLLLCALYFVWGPVSRLLRKRGVVWVWAVLGIMLYFDPKAAEAGVSGVLGHAMRTMVLFGLVYVTLRSAVSYILRKGSEDRVSWDELRPGLVLSDEAWGTVEALGKGGGEKTPRRYPDGLFPDDLEDLRSWSAVPHLVLVAYKSSAFAIWVFLGTLLTVSLERNIMYWIIRAVAEPAFTVQAIRGAWGF